MKKYYDGMFYTVFWRHHLYYNKYDSTHKTVVYISVVEMLVLGGIMFLCACYTSIFDTMDKKGRIIILSIPLIFNYIFFLYGKRYKRIIRNHKQYKNSRIRQTTNMLTILSCVLFFVAASIAVIPLICRGR